MRQVLQTGVLRRKTHSGTEDMLYQLRPYVKGVWCILTQLSASLANAGWI